jgi:hypothetical protein
LKHSSKVSKLGPKRLVYKQLLALGFIFQFCKVENLANCVKKTANLVEIAFKNKLVQKICFKRIAKLQKTPQKELLMNTCICWLCP